jgi:O-antigen ligase
MAAQATIICCLAIKNRPLQIVAILISIVTMFWCQSRGSMLATGFGVLAVLMVLSLTKRLSAWIWLFAPAFFAPLAIFGVSFFADKILQLSDPNRGMQSGFTGRASAWRETLELFYNHPLFGVGYRENDQYLTSAAGAHNAYLATLADVGLFGASAYLLLMFGGLLAALSKAVARPTPGRLMAAAFLSAFVVNGLFERNALNVGNFYSVLAIVICVWSWRVDGRDGEAMLALAAPRRRAPPPLAAKLAALR